jgi:hypothetical protein
LTNRAISSRIKKWKVIMRNQRMRAKKGRSIFLSPPRNTRLVEMRLCILMAGVLSKTHHIRAIEEVGIKIPRVNACRF